MLKLQKNGKTVAILKDDDSEPTRINSQKETIVEVEPTLEDIPEDVRSLEEILGLSELPEDKEVLHDGKKN